MKKALKYSLLLIITIFITFTTSGCTDDNMDNIDIYVTNYANEYITKELYGEHATVTSIYPDGIDINKYKVSKKQKEIILKLFLFIYTFYKYNIIYECHFIVNPIYLYIMV